MKGMILAAGKGLRLRPLTLMKPKPALPLASIPLIRYSLSFLSRNGVSQVMVNLHHLPEGVREAVAGVDSLEVHFSFEDQLLGTGGALKKVASFFDEGTFILMNGDILVDLDMKEVIEAHKKRKAKATMVLIPPPRDHRYSLVEISEDGFVRRFHRGEGNRRRSFVFSGIHILEPELLSLFPDGPSEIIPSLYLPLIERKERVLGYVLNCFWQEIGTAKLFLDANLKLIRSKLPPYIKEMVDEVNELWKGGELIKERGVYIPPSVTVEGGAVVGGESIIGEDVFLSRVVIGRGVQIGASSFLANSVVFDGSIIPPGTKLKDKVIFPPLPQSCSYKEVEEGEGFFSSPL